MGSSALRGFLLRGEKVGGRPGPVGSMRVLESSACRERQQKAKTHSPELKLASLLVHSRTLANGEHVMLTYHSSPHADDK